MARSKTSGDRGERRDFKPPALGSFSRPARVGATHPGRILRLGAVRPPVGVREAFWNVLHAARRLFPPPFRPPVDRMGGIQRQDVRGPPLAGRPTAQTRVYMTLGDKRQLLPAHQSGVFHIHGLAHELGHIVLYRSLVNLSF